MRYLTTISLALLVGCGSESAHNHSHGTRPAIETRSAAASDKSSDKPADALSALHHPINTKSPAAQLHFNNGLTLVYAFNHDEAIRSFKKALAADPNCAMAHWGIALALGPNYNVDVDAEREKQAYAEIQKAIELSKNGPAQEQAYIATLATRFSGADNPDLKKLASDYAKAAGELSSKYPDDSDAAVLYADARMCLRPWKLWTPDYKPAEGTEEIVVALEAVLRRDPDHIGANHLYIHAVEASRHPDKALEAAARLPGLAPDCGHLVHMPSHIYARVGDHESAVTSNESAVEVDRAYFKRHPEGKGGIYEMMYYPHNMHFIAYAQAWQGNYAGATPWAKEVYDHALPHVAHMGAMMEGFTVVPLGLETKFRKWDVILATPSPDEKTMPNTTAMWHFARGMAFAAKGDVSQATSERDKLVALKSKFAPEAMMGMLNTSQQVFAIAQNVLEAKIAAQQKNYAEAERLLRAAGKLEDELTYMEPPDWLCPSRESLGGMLLISGNPQAAEKVFREDLNRNPRNGRSLFGLWKSLEAQNKTYDASLVKRQFDTAWKNADTKLDVGDL